MRNKIRILFFAVMMASMSIPCPGAVRTYRVEVLQVTSLEVLQKLYDGFIRELKQNGMVSGKNLVIKRTIVDFDIENPSLRKEIAAYLKIKKEASRIASEKPDLALTMGTPATKFSKETIVAAGVPLVFTALAFPSDVGSRSWTEAGPGFTGVVTYMNMRNALLVIRKAFPSIRSIGIVYSYDSNSVDHVDEAVRAGRTMGLRVIAKQVDVKQRIVPALRELRRQGVDAFVVPPDPYYAIRNYGAAHELVAFSEASRIPVISFVIDSSSEAVLNIGVDFEIIGRLCGRQAFKIMKEGAKPGSLPILRQQNLTVTFDPERMKAMGLPMSQEIPRVTKPVE